MRLQLAEDSDLSGTFVDVVIFGMVMANDRGHGTQAMRWLLSVILAVVAAGPAMAGCYGRTTAEPQSRFRLLGGEAQDTRSDLSWQRCSYGTEWNGRDRCVGQIVHLGLDDAIKAAPPGWRVPSGPELESLVDPDCGSPVVDPSVFPDIRPDAEGLAKYWTTNATGMLDLYWNFDFIDGHPDGNSRGIRLAVRFVRNHRP